MCSSTAMRRFRAPIVSNVDTYGRYCGVKASPHRLRHSCATLLVSVQMIIGHKRIIRRWGYTCTHRRCGVRGSTMARSQRIIIRRCTRSSGSWLCQKTRPKTNSRRIGELIALTDALRNGSLNSQQTELVRALREGLGLLETKSMESP